MKFFSNKKIGAFLYSILGGALLMMWFQNCAPQVQFALEGDPLSAAGVVGVKENSESCFFNGAEIADGTLVTAFQNSSVTFGSQCVSEQRVCENGALSGSFNSTSCAVNAPQSCQFGGAQIDHGKSVMAFLNSTESFGNTCTSQIRTCNDGVLSGSHQYAACAVEAEAACLFNGVQVAPGASVTAFVNSSVPYGQTCVQETRTCANGSLSGSYQYASCAVAQASSCLFNGQQVAHGASVNAFASSSVPFGRSCEVQSRTCQNGVLSGSNQYASCAIEAPQACLFNGITYAHGASLVAYTSSTVSYSSDCSTVAQTRTCNNGALTGSAPYASCSKNAPKSCLLGKRTLAHGESIKAAEAAVVVAAACQWQTRTCQDGSLSGSYTNHSCVEQYQEEQVVDFTKSAAPLDMVWVIDNSGSMSQEAAQVRNNLNSFLTSLSGQADFKFALISQAGTSGTRVSIPSQFTGSNYLQINKSIGSWNGPNLLLSELKNNTAFSGFFRADSKKIIVFVTDDNATVTGSSGGLPLDATAFLNSLLIQQNWKVESVSQFAFAAPSDRACPSRAAIGSTYEALASLTAGYVYNLCDTNWSPNFNSLVNHSISKASRLITLSRSNINQILSVKIGGRLLDTTQYSFSGQMLTIADSVTINEGERIVIDYTLLPQAMKFK